MKIQVFHYTYRITDKLNNKFYYGFRKSKIHPKNDLGKIYFSSSTDKKFIKDQKDDPERFKYKIILISDKIKCLNFECRLHSRFDVKNNDVFYNKSNQTNTKFSTSGANFVRKHNNEIYIFKNKLTGEEIKSDIRGMCDMLKDRNIERLLKDCKTIKNWYIVGTDYQRRKDPKVTNILLKNTTYVFKNKTTGEVFIGTPKDLCDELNVKKYFYITPFIYGEVKVFHDYMLMNNYVKMEKDKKMEDAIEIKNTKFLFKRMVDDKEEYKTPVEMEMTYGVPYYKFYNLISGLFKSSFGWCMGWYEIPYEEKKNGEHNKYNNKDLTVYKVLDIKENKELLLTRDDFKRMLGNKESLISLFINDKIKTLHKRYILIRKA